MKYAKLVSIFDGRLQVALMAFRNKPGEVPSLKASYIDTDGQIATIEMVPEKEKTLKDYQEFYDDKSLVSVIESIIYPRLGSDKLSAEQAYFATSYEVDGVGEVLFLSQGEDTEMYFMAEDQTVCSFGLYGVDVAGVDAMPDHLKHYYVEVARGRVPLKDDFIEGSEAGKPYLH